MKLVKYMSLMYGIKSVVEGSFKMSKASEFNDPFDCDGRLTESSPPWPLVPADIKAMKDANDPRYLDAYMQWLCRFRDGLVSKQLIDKYYRIMCFRKYTGQDDYTDRLFWSHYADHGKGIRVIFDLEAEDCCGELEEVEYREERPVCDLSKVTTSFQDPVLIDFMHRRIFTKGMQWKDENEVRLSVPLNGDAWKPYGSDAVIFLPIKHAQIVGVDFGVNVSDVSAESWTALCRTNQTLSHVWFRRAEKQRENYCYDYADLK